MARRKLSRRERQLAAAAFFGATVNCPDDMRHDLIREYHALAEKLGCWWELLRHVEECGRQMVERN